MTLAPGALLKQYRLVEQIGAGGMGEVWSAEDPALRRTVAIKVPALGLARPAVTEGDGSEYSFRHEPEWAPIPADPAP